MLLYHKMKGIPYGAVSQEEEYKSWHCATRRRVFIILLCHKEIIQYSPVPQVVESPLCCCNTRRRVSVMALCHRMEGIHYAALSQE